MPYTERSAPQVILNKMTKAQFDSIEKDQNQLYAVTDIEIATQEYVDSKTSDNYSTTEQAVGTWIDGKTIYKKTIDCGNLVNNDVKRVNHNITGLKQVVKMESTMYSGADAWILPYPYADRISLEGSQILINVPGNLASYKAHVTVFYTKN